MKIISIYRYSICSLIVLIAGCGGPSVPTKPLQPRAWQEIPNWKQDNLTEAFIVFLRSCEVLKSRQNWQEVCDKAGKLNMPEHAILVNFFETNFIPHQVINPDETTEGLITGYYEPVLQGSRVKREPYIYPIYAQPDDLLTIDLSSVYPELKNYRLRGRLIGNRVVPYYSRSEIEKSPTSFQSKEIAWVDNPVELFFLGIQGSGRVLLENGDSIRVGYADQNGHPYRAIGRYLVDKGELKLEEATMQGIKAWITSHPDRIDELLHYNASYVFFRLIPNHTNGPIGALTVALTPERSLAVDANTIPLGAPVFLMTTLPGSNEPLQRLMVAQDTGGAIRGAVRADFFWGSGVEAGEKAGKMRQQGKMWVFLPR